MEEQKQQTADNILPSDFHSSSNDYPSSDELDADDGWININAPGLLKRLIRTENDTNETSDDSVFLAIDNTNDFHCDDLSYNVLERKTNLVSFNEEYLPTFEPLRNKPIKIITNQEINQSAKRFKGLDRQERRNEYEYLDTYFNKSPFIFSQIQRPPSDKSMEKDIIKIFIDIHPTLFLKHTESSSDTNNETPDMEYEKEILTPFLQYIFACYEKDDYPSQEQFDTIASNTNNFGLELDKDALYDMWGITSFLMQFPFSRHKRAINRLPLSDDILLNTIPDAQLDNIFCKYYK